MSEKTSSKLELKEERSVVIDSDAIALVSAIFRKIGCSETIALQVAEHLADTSLCGMESHGLMRTLQYAEQFRTGYIDPKAEPRIMTTDKGVEIVDGGGGIGIPAMHMAYKRSMELAARSGIAAIAIRNVGHTGRHGAFADDAAEKGFLTIMLGGGNRKIWRQVAPHGGAKAMLPTNPYCIGMPGGAHGPVVLDFATSKIAGGWIYAARSAGALLPEGCVIDKHGNATRNPEDYFNGGAILPSGEHKGYALALVAELVGEALLGPSTTEANWLLITLEAGRFREGSQMREAAEEVLAELRNCPPAPGFARVMIPGERERDHRQACQGSIAIPRQTWQQITDLARSLGIA